MVQIGRPELRRKVVLGHWSLVAAHTWWCTFLCSGCIPARERALNRYRRPRCSAGGSWSRSVLLRVRRGVNQAHLGRCYFRCRFHFRFRCHHQCRCFRRRRHCRRHFPVAAQLRPLWCTLSLPKNRWHKSALVLATPRPAKEVGSTSGRCRSNTYSCRPTHGCRYKRSHWTPDRS
jgi:hypothetical protein